MHVVGGVAGGAITGGVAWLILSPLRTLFPPEVSVGIVIAAAVAATLVDARVIHVKSTGSQVPPVWLTRYGPQRSYGMYGFMFGVAFATIRTYAVIYAVFLAMGLLGTFPTAAAGGALFGLGRTAIIGPASLRATLVSKVLYRGRGVWRAWTLGSAALSAATVLVALRSAG